MTGMRGIFGPGGVQCISVTADTILKVPHLRDGPYALFAPPLVAACLPDCGCGWLRRRASCAATRARAASHSPVGCVRTCASEVCTASAGRDCTAARGRPAWTNAAASERAGACRTTCCRTKDVAATRGTPRQPANRHRANDSAGHAASSGTCSHAAITTA